ncbi:MAG TPA: GNAT family N-acetyltransferase [Bdellovibrionota bacterium]|jgi:RimJ/RimL family protein N-acetyltransferase|nr:GNAT family N-acetyltransferase [Bdellovibrionota bacterium]
MLEIRLAQLDDLEAYAAHLIRHRSESGNDGDIIFHPLEDTTPKPIAEMRAHKAAKWSLDPTEVGWERAWVLSNSREIFGEVKLVHMPATSTCLHRAVLMMGIERPVRGQGWGTRLVQTAIDWAKTQPHLTWIQLFVFAHNEPARRLYKKFGFVETGGTRDAFRVHGKSLDDISMDLKLR